MDQNEIKDSVLINLDELSVPFSEWVYKESCCCIISESISSEKI